VLSLAASIIAAVACPPTAVHYTPNGVPGIQQIPWIQAAPASAGIRGLLWYYDSAGAWGKTHVPFAHVYAGGEDPSGRVSMKILWVARRSGGGPAIAITGRRLDGDGLSNAALVRASKDYRTDFLRGDPFESPLELAGDVVFSCLKGAEPGGGLVLRVFNPNAQPEALTLSVPARRIRLDEDEGVDGGLELAPGEIATFQLGK